MIDILGKPFVLFITKDMGGDLVTWGAEDGSYIIYATPNYDGYKGIPIALNDSDGLFIDGDCYPCTLDKQSWFDEYCGIVKAAAGKLIEDYEKHKT